MSVNLDDTSRCPQAKACERCGKAGPTVEVVMVGLAHLGVACASLCRGCRMYDRLPRWGVPESLQRIGEHCEHLGIDVDDMAAALEADS